MNEGVRTTEEHDQISEQCEQNISVYVSGEMTLQEVVDSVPLFLTNEV